MHLPFKRYRRTYFSEDIIVERTLNQGNWSARAETVPNMVINNQISNTAVVIGNGTIRQSFDLNHLKKASGLLGSKTVQTYGCNALYRDFNPDFLVARGNDNIIEEIANSNYPQNNIVYSSGVRVLDYPGKFYLIPHDIYTDAGTTALYLACFDEHKTVYMLGFDGHEPGWNNNVYADTNGYDAKDFEIDHSEWITNRKRVIDVYDDVDFVWVTPRGTHSLPEPLKYCLNLRQISLREMVLECDL